MAGRAAGLRPHFGARRMALLGVALLLAHLVALEFLARHLEQPSVLKRLADPMFTRLLAPQAPPAPATSETKRPAGRTSTARPAISSIAKPKRAAPPPAAAPAPEAVAQAPQPAQAASEPIASAPELATPTNSVAASTPAATSTTPGATLDTWPTDTRLSYRLGGRFRSGPLYGNAQVQWQRDAAEYQVRVSIDVPPWAHLVMTSQGRAAPDGLLPRAYEEVRQGRHRRAALMGDTTVLMEKDRTAPRPANVQDSASQFVELAHRFATGQETLDVGRPVQVWLARPEGLALWTYDVKERETLQLPTLGAVEAFHLVPRPLERPRGDITAEMWFAPALQYLPVRIRVSMGTEAELDLLVERIEQR